MQDELTTAMHAEFMECEMSAFDLTILAVGGAMARGLTKGEALAKYNMDEATYDANKDRVDDLCSSLPQ